MYIDLIVFFENNQCFSIIILGGIAVILVIFTLVALLFYWIACRIRKSEKPVNLWANDSSEIKVTDIHAYNQACSRLLKVYALLLFGLGFLISTEHTVAIILGYLLIVFASLGVLICYTMIEGKWKK